MSTHYRMHPTKYTQHNPHASDGIAGVKERKPDTRQDTFGELAEHRRHCVYACDFMQHSHECR
jgi:hypothetical protein